jgi:hypothetical protein
VALTLDEKGGGFRVCGRHAEVWGLDIGLPIAIFHCDARARCYAAVDERRVIRDAGGRVYLLSLRNDVQGSVD